MAVTYGFFNSINGDRKYNADQMSDYFRGIVNQGVFQHLDNGLAVSAGTGMEVNVATGRAIVQNKWIQNDMALPLTIEAASDTYGRKDAVVIRLSYTNRNISIVVKTGTPAASPTAPSMTRNSTTYEMALAYVNVAANATSVTVTDKRSDSTVCGWVTVAQSTSGEVDAQLNAMKTGFDGVVYPSPAAMVQGCDEVLDGRITEVKQGLHSFNKRYFMVNTGLHEVDLSAYANTEIVSYSTLIFEPNSNLTIEISGYSYHANGTGANHRSAYYFLDANGDLVSKYTGSDGPVSVTLVTPPTAVKLIVNGTVLQSSSGDYRPFIKVLTMPYKTYYDRMNYKMDGTVVDLSSSIANNEYYSYAQMNFTAGSSNWFHLRGIDYQTGQRAGYIFYDASGTAVSTISPVSGVFFDVTVQAPATACKVVVNGMINPVTEKYYAPVIEFVSQTTQPESPINSKFKNRKIVWFGTSIPANPYQGGKTYPAIIGDMLGATVYNEAISSSALRIGVDTSPLTCKVLSLSATYAEKQAQSWWSSLSEADKTKAYNSCLDVVFDKYLSGGSVGPVDLYVFDHGYNDVIPNDHADLEIIPDNEFDKRYFVGAANFLIQRILNDNPRAKIIWIGHYEDQLDNEGVHQNRGKTVCPMQEYIADKWGIPICKTWSKLGWSGQTATTTGYWNNGYWVASGGTSQEIVVKDAQFPDGIHPHTDKSGDSVKAMANVIADFLETLP